jgi:hypothetical protein
MVKRTADRKCRVRKHWNVLSLKSQHIRSTCSAVHREMSSAKIREKRFAVIERKGVE